MKLKTQINKQTFLRIAKHPQSIKGKLEYQRRFDYGKKHSYGSFLLNGFIYAEVECKPNNKPTGTVKHNKTFIRYAFFKDIPVADHIEFFV